jgi:E3 ubiquitin-protein ligase BRE1
VRARQLRDSLLMDKQTMEKEIQQANISVDFFDVKAARIEDQVFPSGSYFDICKK